MTPALAVRTRILSGFDDPAFGPDQWDALLRSGGTDTIYLTWHWQRAWWETVGKGQLLLVTAERDGRVVALAPFYSRWKMVSFLGSEIESDYLDFIGDVRDAEVLDALLDTARQVVPGFSGFDLRLIPEKSATTSLLPQAAARLRLLCEDEWGRGAPAPTIDLAGRPEVVTAITQKRSVLKDERFLQKDGTFAVHHFREAAAILPQLDAFLVQHIARRAVTEEPSPLLDPAQRAFYRRFTGLAADTGVLRFTRVDWQDRPIAFHYGLSYRGRYYWYGPTFAIDLARRSPGRILLRHLVLAAIAEGAHTFDFGVGDEAFKGEWSTDAEYVREWKLYPK